MYKLCKTEQSAERQRQLEQGLLQTLLTAHYDEITVSDLCARLGAPRKSFYRYFDGKEGALHALLDHTLMTCQVFPSLYTNGKAQTSVQVLEQFFLFWLEHRLLLEALKRSDLSGVLIQRAIGLAHTETGISMHIHDGETSQMQEHITMFSICGLMSLVLWWQHRNYSDSPRSMAATALRLLTQPLFPKL